MTAEEQDSRSDGAPPPEPGDRSETTSGPRRWEAERIRLRLSRLRTAFEEDGDAFPPSDAERLLSDVLTAAFGPPRPSSAPVRFRDDPEAAHAYARRRKRERERERDAARVRLARRFRTPMHPKQWAAVVRTALRTLDRRTYAWERPDWSEEGGAFLKGPRLPDWETDALAGAGVGEGLHDLLAEEHSEPDVRASMAAFYDALLLAVEGGLSDSKVREADPEKLEGRLRRKIGKALKEELTFEEWDEDEDDESPSLTSIYDTAEEESETPLHDLLPDESARVHDALMAQETLTAKVEAEVRRARRLFDVASPQQRDVLLARLDPFVGRVLRDREGLTGNEARLAEAEAETWSAVAEECGIDKRNAHLQYERLLDKLDEND